MHEKEQKGKWKKEKPTISKSTLSVLWAKIRKAYDHLCGRSVLFFFWQSHSYSSFGVFRVLTFHSHFHTLFPSTLLNWRSYIIFSGNGGSRTQVSFSLSVSQSVSQSCHFTQINKSSVPKYVSESAFSTSLFFDWSMADCFVSSPSHHRISEKVILILVLSVCCSIAFKICVFFLHLPLHSFSDSRERHGHNGKH